MRLPGGLLLALALPALPVLVAANAEAAGEADTAFSMQPPEDEFDSVSPAEPATAAPSSSTAAVAAAWAASTAAPVDTATAAPAAADAAHAAAAEGGHGAAPEGTHAVAPEGAHDAAPEGSHAASAEGGHGAGEGEHGATTCQQAAGDWYDGDTKMVVTLGGADGTDFTATFVEGTNLPLAGKLYGDCVGGVFALDGVNFESIMQVKSDRILWNDGTSWTKAPYGAATGHGEAHGDVGHGHGHAPPDSVAVTVAVMLFVMLCMGIGMLYLVNSPDEDIKSSTYEMINSTMCVFCAVLINQAILTALIDQLMHGYHPGLGIHNSWLEALVGVLVLVGFGVAMNIMGWKARKNTRFHRLIGDVMEGGSKSLDDESLGRRRRALLYATTHLGGHCIAFAGISATASVLHVSLHWDDFSEQLAFGGLTVVGTVLFFFVASRAAQSLRRRLINEKTLSQQDKDFYKLFVSNITHGEIDGIVIVCSFVVNQLVCIMFLNETMNLHGKQRNLTWQDVRQMAQTALVFAVLAFICVVNFARSGVQKLSHAFAVPFMAMSMSWAAQWTSLWTIQMLLQNHKTVSTGLCMVINGFCVSVFCVICIWLLDMWADRKEAAAKKKKEQLRDARADRAEVPALWGSKIISSSNLDLEDSEFSKGLRGVTVAFGLLVALSWDKAFDAAIGTIIDAEKAYMGDNAHEVILKVFICVAMVVPVCFAWYFFIVPQVLQCQEQKHGHHHHHHAPEDDLACLDLVGMEGLESESDSVSE